MSLQDRLCSLDIYDGDTEFIYFMSDTESMYTKALQTIAGRYGATYNWDLKVKMMGKTYQEGALVFIREFFYMSNCWSF